jgi:putative redox protein
MISLDWKGKMAFEATPPTRNKWTMDAYPEVGGQNLGPTPLEAFVGGAAACSAMDVIHILKLKRQEVTGYHVEVDGDRDDKGPYPRPYRTLTIRHYVEGNVDPKVLADAVAQSDAKFCSAIATLRHGPAVASEWELVGQPVTP